MRNLVSRPQMHMQRCPGGEAPGAIAGEQLQTNIDTRCGYERPRVGEPIATSYRTRLYGRQVQSTTLTGATAVGGLVLRVDASDTHLCPGRHDGHRVSRLDLAGEHRSGYNSAVPAEGENAIYGQTK